MRPNPDDPFDRFNVVVIEDDAVMRLVIGMIFEEDPRFRICWHAGSADRALRLAQAERRRVDLIILDDVLEGPTSGAQLAPSLHRMWPGASVVMFTADPERVPSVGPVVATVAKTAPELLLETARRIVETDGLRRDGVAGAGAAPGTVSIRRTTPRRHRLSVLAGPARWAAVAAVLVALLAASGRVPPPPRLVTDLAGFVAELLPESLSDTRPDDAGPKRGNRDGSQPTAPAWGRSLVDAEGGGASSVPEETPRSRADEEHPADRGPASAGERPLPASERPPRRSPGPAPQAGTPPVTPPVTDTRPQPSPATTARPPEEAGNSGRQPGRALPNSVAPAKRNGAPIGAATTIEAPIAESPQAGAADPKAQAGRPVPAATPEPE